MCLCVYVQFLSLLHNSMPLLTVQQSLTVVVVIPRVHCFTLASSVQSCVAYIHKLSAIHAIFYSYMQMVYVRPSISVFFNKFVSVSPTYIFRAFVLTDIVLIVFVHLAYRHSALYYCLTEISVVVAAATVIYHYYRQYIFPCC